MPLVTVKPKFQVTIPARIRKGIDLREGDIMEATLVGGGILFVPKELVDKAAAADRIADRFTDRKPAVEDIARTEDEIMTEAIADIAKSRRERRSAER